MIHEDMHLDCRARVEPCASLFQQESPAMVLLLMTPCRNCGELRPRDDPSILRNGLCALCNDSDELHRVRGNSSTATRNRAFLDRLGMDDDDQEDDF